LENFHLLEAQFKEVDEGLPANYFKGLPVLVQPPLAGLPRVYGVAWAFVAHTDGAFDESLLVHFLNAYQQSCELRLSELVGLADHLAGGADGEPAPLGRPGGCQQSRPRAGEPLL